MPQSYSQKKKIHIVNSNVLGHLELYTDKKQCASIVAFGNCLEAGLGPTLK
jgi:hypothetical protein